MSRRRVGKIAPISATSPSSPVDIGQTNSILTDPDGRWVAKRQSDINAALEHRQRDPGPAGPDDDAFSRNGAIAMEPENPTSAQKNPPRKFSGESTRIGKGNWDEKTPFGKHVGYL